MRLLVDTLILIGAYPVWVLVETEYSKVPHGLPHSLQASVRTVPHIMTIPSTSFPIHHYLPNQSMLKCNSGLLKTQLGARDIAVDIANRYELTSSGFEPRWWQEIFYYRRASRPALGPTKHPIHWLSGKFSGSKAAEAGEGANHPPLFSVQVKNE